MRHKVEWVPDQRPGLTSSGKRVKHRGIKKRRILCATAVLLFSSDAILAQSLTRSIDANDPNDVLLVSFTLSAPASLNVQSYGYGGSGNAPGGRNAAGSIIAPGGFDPYVSVFSGIGPTAT